MRIVKSLGIAGGMVAAALVGGTLISAAAASPSTSAGPAAGNQVAGDNSAYCEQWRQAFANALGVSVDALTPAAKSATEATIDAAVANGDLPADIGERMKNALENANGDGCRLLGAGFQAWGRHAVGADWRHDWVAAAADVLGIDPSALVADLHDGQTLMEIADTAGVSYDDLSAAIIDAAKTDLDALGHHLAEAYPEADKDTGITLVPLKEDVVGHVQPFLLVLLASVGFVLLIACVNVANLLLARSMGRANRVNRRTSNVTIVVDVS